MEIKKDFFKVFFLRRHGFFQNRSVVKSNGTDKTDWRRGVVLLQVSAYELQEVVEHQRVYALIVQMVRAETGQFGQKTVREGLAVHFLNNIRNRGLILLEERLL